MLSEEILLSYRQFTDEKISKEKKMEWIKES